MLLLATAIAAATPVAAVEPRVQARATVRILSAEPVRFAEIEASRPAALRSTVIRAADGSEQPARLLEFE